MKKHVIFDLGGVLVDKSTPIAFSKLNKVSLMICFLSGYTASTLQNIFFNVCRSIRISKEPLKSNHSLKTLDLMDNSSDNDGLSILTSAEFSHDEVFLSTYEGVTVPRILLDFMLNKFNSDEILKAFYESLDVICPETGSWHERYSKKCLRRVLSDIAKMAFIPKELVGILTSVSQGDLLLRDIDAYRILIQNHYITNFNENPNELNDINSDDLKQVTDKMLNKMKSKEKRVGWKRESTKEFDSKVGNLINDIVQLPSTTRDPFYIYLLSNFNSEAFHLMRAKYPTLFSMFHDTMCSGDVLLLKPDPQIFEKCIKSWKLNPKECVFIDDTAENVESAKNLGMTGIVFHPSKIGSIRKQLQEMDLLP